MLGMHDGAGGAVNSIDQSNVHLRTIVQDERMTRIRDECHGTAFFVLAQSRHALTPQLWGQAFGNNDVSWSVEGHSPQR